MIGEVELFNTLQDIYKQLFFSLQKQNIYWISSLVVMSLSSATPSARINNG